MENHNPTVANQVNYNTCIIINYAKSRFQNCIYYILCYALFFRCEFVSERVLHEDHPTISTWLADAQVNDLEVQELLSVLTEDIIKRKLITA